MAQKQLFQIMPLFMVIFIDTLSGTLLGPLMPALFVDNPNSILSPDISNALRYFLFGLTQAIVFIAMFFSSPILGDLADRLGRKKIIMVSLGGALAGYLLTVAAIVIHSISLLLVGRFIAGLTAGSISAAKAAVIDISSDETRTTNIGYVLLALSLGSILGPLISGILSNSHWVSWFGLTTPIYAAALLSFINVIYLHFAFTEKYKPSIDKPIEPLSGLRDFAASFVTPGIRGLAVSFFLMQLGWSTYIQFISLFLALKYQFNPHEIGIYMAITGLGFTLAFCYLLTFLTSHFSLRHIALVSISLIVVFLFAMVSFNQVKIAWVLSVPSATCLAISYSVLISLFSESVSKDKQGWVMGMTGAIGAFAFGASGLIAGILVDVNASAPLWLALILLFFSVISLYFTTVKRL
jgi:MFS family permease